METKMTRTGAYAAVALLFTIALVFSAGFSGMGLTPASGTYNFTKQGGTIQFVVSNLNDYETEFSIKPYGGASDGNRYIGKITPGEKVTVKPKDFKVFYLHVTPDETVEYGRRYIIGIQVKNTGALGPGGAGEGIGVSGLESASAGFYVHFENKGTTVNYGGFEEESTRRLQERMNQKPNYLPLILSIILIALLLGLFVFFLVKRKKDGDDGGEEIVYSGGKGPN